MKTTLLCVAAVLVLLAAPALANDDDDLEFKAKLTGAQVLGDPDTDGTARAQVNFDDGFTEVAVKVNIRVDDLVGTVTRAHFHCNVAGANGPIALGLIDPGPLMLEGRKIEGVLTNDDFPAVDPCPAVIDRPVNNVAALAFAMNEGLIYLNIHTDAFPGGEIRGQMRPGDRDDDDRDGRGSRH